ncbi:hypothetical protein QTN47_27410 [Danxiaibacter flavus]|uniref:Tail spike domain-containing protein n=1 Tax=Danxiaibacter flavus TaxID=3049108 RepID=A0ABV3ZN47_9BACT|nr:hypothetical protein QNM32_27410 [Chitinophagaceae bacterium DXS]
MTTIEIFRGSGYLTTIKPEDNSVQVKKIMGENELRISFKLNLYIDFLVNDFCTVFGERYQLNQPPTVKKVASTLYEYDMVMESEASNLAKVQYLFLGDDNTLKEADFSLMGNAETFLDLLIQNANRVGSGWIKGQVISTIYKNLTFSAENCYNVLGRLSEEFETEFWVDGKTIHVTRRQRDKGYVFQHGRNKGLYDITRQNVDSSNIVTRLYAFGSDKNIPSDYRNYSKRLKMDVDYIEENTQQYGIIESTQIFDDIYPHRTGTVTSVNATDSKKFIDTTLDFDINDQLLAGISAKVVFNTGQLSGYTLEISKFDNSTKEFTLLKNKDERTLEIPNDDIRPAIGDQYVLVDIKMPDSYITAAEQQLKAKAYEVLALNSGPQLSYKLSVDPVFMKKKGYSLSIGDLVWLKDDELNVRRRIRVTSCERNIIDENRYNIEIADAVQVGTIAKLMTTQSNTGRDVNDLGRSVQNNAILNGNVIGTLKFDSIPVTSTTTGFSQIYIEDSTGKLYKKI